MGRVRWREEQPFRRSAFPDRGIQLRTGFPRPPITRLLMMAQKTGVWRFNSYRQLRPNPPTSKCKNTAALADRKQQESPDEKHHFQVSKVDPCCATAIAKGATIGDGDRSGGPLPRLRCNEGLDQD
jgi:hypothetical protein